MLHRHEDRRVLPFTPAQMFALVADVRRYPEFLPWCAALRVRSEEDRGETRVLVADMIAAYKGLNESFRSRVTLNEGAKTIDVEYIDGPFAQLANRWRFEPMGDGASRVHFLIEYEFKSRVLGVLARKVFARVFEKMSDAFEERARALYTAA